jgi:DNA-binding CsgD family transcriptional regulator
VTQWTAPQTDELRRLVKAGYSNDEIARRFGMTPGAVREKCRRIGIRRTRHRTKSLTQDEALAELEMVAKVIRQQED